MAYGFKNEKDARPCKMKLCLWDVVRTVSLHDRCRLPLLQNNIVWLENLTQASNKVGVAVIELNGGSSSRLFIYLNATLKLDSPWHWVYLGNSLGHKVYKRSPELAFFNNSKHF